ncbi:MAG: UbiX family flavin prenyltransferase [Desulfovibrionales bacterium]
MYPEKKRIILAVTGASGMAYGFRLAQVLSSRCELHLILSDAARLVIQEEASFAPDTLFELAHTSFTQHEFGAGPASGSWTHAGMVVCPCSMASLAAISHGLGTNLIHRAADVTIKEKRPLILVTRETPVSIIHLENMLAAARSGAVVLPASPGFYHRPVTIDDLVDHLVGRVLDQLGFEHDLFPSWKGVQGLD